jgi:hypothetical protein
MIRGGICCDISTCMYTRAKTRAILFAGDELYLLVIGGRYV